MRKLRATDLSLVSRFVDGELTGQALAEFERRLLQEQALREAVDEQRAVRDWFRQVRVGGEKDVTETVGPPDDFARRVVRAARRLPSRQALASEAAVPGEAELDERAAVRIAKGLVAAAVLVGALGLLVAGGLVGGRDSGVLEAADQRRIEEIDRGIRREDRREEELRPR